MLEPEAGWFKAPANHPAIHQDLFALVADNIVRQTEDALAEEVRPFAEMLVEQRRARRLEEDQAAARNRRRLVEPEGPVRQARTRIDQEGMILDRKSTRLNSSH